MNLTKACVPLAVVCIGIGLAALQGRPVAAQAFFETGYVVTLEGDTLRGQIDNREWVRNPEDVRIQKRRGRTRPDVHAAPTRGVLRFWRTLRAAGRAR